MSRLVDALVVAWVVAVDRSPGSAVGGKVHDLAEISNHARDAGIATQRAADYLDDVPLIGDERRGHAPRRRREHDPHRRARPREDPHGSGRSSG